MKLVNFRGVAEREIRLADGVTIVEGLNETGKSSFQDALDLLFRRKATASASEVLDAIPQGQDVGPEVEVELETGPYALVFRKRFRRRPETVLRILRPRSEQLVGDQAHERANEILDLTLDRNLWERLRVRQHEKLEPATVGSASALMSALDRLSGEGGQPPSASPVLGRAEAEYKRYFTLRRGVETGELQAARRAADEAQHDFAAASVELAELEGRIDQFERLQQGLGRLERQLVEARAEAAKHAAALRGFESVKQRVDKAQAAYAQAETVETHARGRVAERAALKARADEAAKALKAAEARHAEVAAAFAALKSEHDQLEQSLSEARQAEEAAHAELTTARRRLAYLEASDRRTRAQARIRRIDELHSRIEEANAGVAANSVDEDRIGRVRDADRARREALAALQAGAPEIAIEALRSFEALVDGEPVSFAAGTHRAFPLAEELRLELSGVLRLRARPGASLADLQRARDGAQAHLERLLAECGADSVAGAERRARERIRLLEDAKDASTEARTLLAGETISTMRSELAGLIAQLDTLATEIGSLEDVERDAAIEASADAEAVHRQAAERREAIEIRLRALTRPHAEEGERLRHAGSALEKAHDEARNAVAALAEARERTSDELVDKTLWDAEATRLRAFADLQEQQRGLAAHHEDTVRSLATNSH